MSEQLTLHVGDHVQDRDDEDDATLLVIGISPQSAQHYSVNGDQTVADYNQEYPAEDDVIEVVYPQRTTGDISALATYAFPRSRLELETALHDRDDEDGGE